MPPLHSLLTDRPTVRMLGTRGVPAAHGGFETAAENIGRHLVGAGWRVVVYCQTEGPGRIEEDNWEGIDRILIPTRLSGPRATAEFDWRAARHAACSHDVCLVFGYNTAIVNLLQSFQRIPLVFNMDGIEWRRQRWGHARRAFLMANEWIARVIGNDLIADHPEINRYLTQWTPSRKVTMIPYGAPSVTAAPTLAVEKLGLQPRKYFTLICRPVAENSILEIVEAFSARNRGVGLVILGNYDSHSNTYHRAVMQAASEEVRFLGPIFDSAATTALRFHSLGYLHGHTVGGTNPSLVEALGCGNPVIAHDNVYNRWVAGDAALYFRNEEDLDQHLDELIASEPLRTRLSCDSRARHLAEFTWSSVGRSYQELLSKYVGHQTVPTDTACAGDEIAQAGTDRSPSR